VKVASATSPGLKHFAYCSAPASTITNSIFKANVATASYGGVIFNSSELTISGSSFIGNTAETHAGAIMNSGTLTIGEGCKFSGNTSKDKGGAMKNICSSGCIGCKICEKNCSEGAVTVDNNLAHIDFTKCTNCGTCIEKCPTKVIKCEF